MIWKKVHPRHVIWFLLTVIFVGLVWIGNGYANRLDQVEGWMKEQNGSLRDLTTATKHIGEMVSEIRVEQKAMQTEQQKIKIDVAVIKRKVEDR